MYPNNRWKRIGIIGGLGPRASAYFCRLLIDICSQEYGATYDYEYPNFILISLNSEGLSEEGVAVKELTLIKEINDSMKVFSKTDVDIVAIACNSIFAHLNRFQNIPSIRVINLPEEVAKATSKLYIDNAIILCSQGLRTAKIYDSHFLSAGLKLHYPDSLTQDSINQTIMDVMNGEKLTQAASRLAKIVKPLSYDYNAVVLACSELSVLVDAACLPNNIVDSMQVLAKVTLKLASLEKT